MTSNWARWPAVVIIPVIGGHAAVRLWSSDTLDRIEAGIVLLLALAFALEEVVCIWAPDTPVRDIH